ncbi:MAG TPA: hypothetical protein VGR87_09955 [Candidatus Limnocylindria bacterium]|jgi:hypothetical protein|nr:hypothetical protein [Candidatus Limnocylindria bacterium]
MATRLKAKATIKYDPNRPAAAPGEIFELDENKYAASIAQLLETGDAELVAMPKRQSAKTDADA